MADIVQLKEDGVAKYLKTHADAIDGIDGKLVRATGNETILGTKNYQEGLQTLGVPVMPGMAVKTIPNADFTNKASAWANLVRVGNMVWIQGQWNTLSTHGANDTPIILNIPAGYKPKSGNEVAVTNIVNSIFKNAWGRINISGQLQLRVEDAGQHGHNFSGFWYTPDKFPLGDVRDIIK